MLKKQTVLNPSVLRLIEEGFEVEVTNQHLLVRSIPYLNANREVQLGILACPYSELKNQDVPPKDHTMWLQGQYPYMADGKPMQHVVNSPLRRELFSGFTVDFFLSNKVNGQSFLNFYDKVVHYHTLFVSEARVIEPNADGRTGIVHPQRDQNSVFQYPDSASSRVGITALTHKFETDKVAIIGLGGTGSYILDQLSKMPIREIHIFDGDKLEPHNAFRMPGAVPFDKLVEQPYKVDYLHELYSHMHRGIIRYSEFVGHTNIAKLDEIDFVFISIDSGSSRRIITTYLLEKGIPFIDVGLGIDFSGEGNGSEKLEGSCQVTLATPDKSEHLERLLVLEDDDPEMELYESNIQIADMNAINAILAINRWKQLKGFYSDHAGDVHRIVFTSSLLSLARSEEK